MHDVVARCLYGVDVNPLAVELAKAKVSLWLEGLQAGAPLGMLDAHIKVGNALLGTTPALLADGIPDGAFSPIKRRRQKVGSSGTNVGDRAGMTW
jgi:type II restriction/modification system DNA methylase subunit YeeA